jgi:hypothetical protein
MGFIGSATTVTIRARLTRLGRQKILTNSNTVFSHFIIGDSDANYYTSELLPSGTVPTTSGNLAYISGTTSDNIAEGVGVNSKLYVTISTLGTQKVVEQNSAAINLTLRELGETTVSGSNLTYVTIIKSASTEYSTNYFKSLSLPIPAANVNTFLNTSSDNGGWADTPFSGLGVSNVLLSVIDNDQYGELIDGKSIKMTLPVYTGYTTGGTPTGSTTYTLYSTFPSTSLQETVLDFQYKDKSYYPQLVFGNQINVAYLVSDQIQRPNNNLNLSWATGYDSYKPFSQGDKETINVQTYNNSPPTNADRIAGIAYLDKGIIAITDQTIVNNIAIDFSGDSATNILNDSLGLYYYTAGTYNTVIDSIQNDLSMDIICIAGRAQFYNTQNPTFAIADNVRISEIAIADVSGNILAIGKTDRHIVKCKNDIVIFNVQIII